MRSMPKRSRSSWRPCSHGSVITNGGCTGLPFASTMPTGLNERGVTLVAGQTEQAGSDEGVKRPTLQISWKDGGWGLVPCARIHVSGNDLQSTYEIRRLAIEWNLLHPPGPEPCLRREACRHLVRPGAVGAAKAAAHLRPSPRAAPVEVAKSAPIAGMSSECSCSP